MLARQGQACGQALQEGAHSIGFLAHCCIAVCLLLPAQLAYNWFVQLCKARAGESMPLLGELALATEELNRARFSMEDVLCRMQAEGVAETCVSSSSSSEDCAPGQPKPGKPVVVSADEALPDVLAAAGGQVSVCEGKACTRSGENKSIYDELQTHFAATGGGPALTRCKCLGQCKHPTSIRSEGPQGEVRVVRGVQLDAVKEQTRGAVAAGGT